MDTLIQLARWEGFIFLGGVFGVVFWKILTGSISLSGLFQTHDEQFSPGRVQLLIFTLIVAVRYVVQVIQNPTAFPEIPSDWIAALGGSQMLYLGGKARGMLFGKDSS